MAAGETERQYELGELDGSNQDKVLFVVKLSKTGLTTRDQKMRGDNRKRKTAKKEEIRTLQRFAKGISGGEINLNPPNKKKKKKTLGMD